MKKLFIILLPTLLWVGVTAAGFGAQSLSNLIEVPIVLGISIAMSFLSKKYDFRILLIATLIFTLILRYFMPMIPE